MVRHRSRKSENRRLRLYFSTILDAGQADAMRVQVTTDETTKSKKVTVQTFLALPDDLEVTVEKIPNPVLVDDCFVVEPGYSSIPAEVRFMYENANLFASRVLREIGIEDSIIREIRLTAPDPPLMLLIWDNNLNKMREMTEAEIEYDMADMRQLAKGVGNILIGWLKESLENRKFFEFVDNPNAQLVSDYWKLVRYSGISVLREFTIPPNSPVLEYAKRLAHRIANVKRTHGYNETFDHWISGRGVDDAE